MKLTATLYGESKREIVAELESIIREIQEGRVSGDRPNGYYAIAPEESAEGESMNVDRLLDSMMNAMTDEEAARMPTSETLDDFIYHGGNP